ncbi:hypothetical protein BC940DRAFT_306842 [Gongronella butleri]|nr:hypothetical protein BC940DRAFT_306842 [Gongronella butleri]
MHHDSRLPMLPTEQHASLSAQRIQRTRSSTSTRLKRPPLATIAAGTTSSGAPSSRRLSLRLPPSPEMIRVPQPARQQSLPVATCAKQDKRRRNHSLLSLSGCAAPVAQPIHASAQSSPMASPYVSSRVLLGSLHTSTNAPSLKVSSSALCSSSFLSASAAATTPSSSCATPSFSPLSCTSTYWQQVAARASAPPLSPPVSPHSSHALYPHDTHGHGIGEDEGNNSSTDDNDDDAASYFSLHRHEHAELDEEYALLRQFCEPMLNSLVRSAYALHLPAVYPRRPSLACTTAANSHAALHESQRRAIASRRSMSSGSLPSPTLLTPRDDDHAPWITSLWSRVLKNVDRTP